MSYREQSRQIGVVPESLSTSELLNISQRDFLRIQVYNLPKTACSILDIYNLFAQIGCEGNITRIRIVGGQVYVDMYTPPTAPFWSTCKLSFTNSRISPEIRPILTQKTSIISSPVHEGKFFPVHIRLPVLDLQIGVYVQPDKFMPKAQCSSRRNTSSPVLSVDLARNRLSVRFPFDMEPHSMVETQNVDVLFFEANFNEISSIRKISHQSGSILVFELRLPPRWYKKVRDERATMSKTTRDNVWLEIHAFRRHTDIDEDINYHYLPVQLYKPTASIDFGRWLAFAVHLNLSNNQILSHYNTLLSALNDWNLEVKAENSLQFIPKKDVHAMSILNRDDLLDTGHNAAFMWDMSSGTKSLEFEVRYQLEVCVSKGILNEHNLNEDFLHQLGDIDKLKACALLESAANKKQRIFNPMKLFELTHERSILQQPMPQGCLLARSCTVTPTTIIWNTPNVEVSNRVIRGHQFYSDRFLRVRFMEENQLGRLKSNTDGSSEALFDRVLRVMNNGIVLGNRHYKYLASGTSQFRENAAYFFCARADLTIEAVRANLGELMNIKTPSKWCARQGQNFSTTRAFKMNVEVKDCLEDIERNGFNFTDGVGKISPFLAEMIRIEFCLKLENPTVFQFRLGGCKGIIAVDPGVRGREVHIRPSQYKFAAKLQGLEIIRTSSYTSASLNRQLILILSNSGVSDSVFKDKMQAKIDSLDKAMTDAKHAEELLRRVGDANQTTLKLANMVMNGFMNVQEPFLMSNLNLWRTWNLKSLKEKAKISLEHSALLLGCVDEYGVLQGHFDSSDENTVDIGLPEIFVQIDSERNGEYRPLECVCVLARHPSLHPGDIRMVQAVDKKELRHLRDVVVMPSTGDRDLPNMCSGGDLDGDDFVVIWDNDLLPKRPNLPPMNYTEKQRARELDRPVESQDAIKFFIQYMKNDNLSIIATSHLCWADKHTDGVESDICIKLAELHSRAVDYAKSGIPAVLDRNMIPKEYPHFMERRYKKQYKSYRILGQLYDMVSKCKFEPDHTLPFDDRILNSNFDIPVEMLESARLIKKDYDISVKQHMAYHSIKTEFEIWSCFVLEHNQEQKDFKLAEELGLVFGMIMNEFRKRCIQAAGGDEFERICPFATAMYIVTAEEAGKVMNDATLPRGVFENWERPQPMISFPWLFDEVLGKVATSNISSSPSMDRNYCLSLQLKKQSIPSSPIDAFDTIINQNNPKLPAEDFLLSCFDDEDHAHNSKRSEKSHANGLCQEFSHLNLLDGLDMSCTSINHHQVDTQIGGNHLTPYLPEKGMELLEEVTQTKQASAPSFIGPISDNLQTLKTSIEDEKSHEHLIFISSDEPGGSAIEKLSLMMQA